MPVQKVAEIVENDAVAVKLLELYWAPCSGEEVLADPDPWDEDVWRPKVRDEYGPDERIGPVRSPPHHMNGFLDFKFEVKGIR